MPIGGGGLAGGGVAHANCAKGISHMAMNAVEQGAPLLQLYQVGPVRL